MKPWIHQEEKSEEAIEVIKKNGLVYLAMEERTGKSLTAILVTEELHVERVLIVTKKGKPADGWNQLLADYPTNKIYLVTTYHQVCNLGSFDWDIVLLDECHNYLTAFPKHSGIWSEVRKVTFRKPIIYISATPCAQTPAQLYGQLALSSWSPWHTYSNYKRWHKDYGEPYTKYFNGRVIDMWDRVDDARVMLCVNHLMVTATRSEIGFEHEPKDKLHYIALTDETKELYNTALKDRIIFVKDKELVCDSIARLRAVLHMLEGGVSKKSSVVLGANDKVKTKEEFLVLTNTEKIDFIKEMWGDREDIAIMYHYRAEKLKLEEAFSNALILQATTNAEGVDLQHVKDLIIYSQDWSTAKHTQRRCRQANKDRAEPIVVNFLLVKDAISEEVYTTVAVNKQNYVDSLFNKTKLGN